MIFLLPGGYEYDGREITRFDEGRVRDAVRKIRDAGLVTAAVSSIFAQINSSMEDRTREIFQQEAPEISVTLSSSFGRHGFLERENAAIMNASLVAMAGQVIHSFKFALDKIGITAPYYISQNDGTLISASYAVRYPVLTFGSGPTNSIRGAAFLTGIEDALVVDIGGTTADIDALAKAPHRGTLQDDILPGLRHVTLGRAVVWCDIIQEKDETRVLAIFFGGQDHIRHMLARLLA